MAAETEGLPHCVALLPCPQYSTFTLVVHGAKPRSQARIEPGNEPPSKRYAFPPRSKDHSTIQLIGARTLNCLLKTVKSQSPGFFLTIS